MRDDITKYQLLSQQTAQGIADPSNDEYTEEHKLLFLALALNGEAGEVAEKVKKGVRDDDESYFDDVSAELGDVLWYMAQLATMLDEDLGDVAGENLEKLMDRDDRDEIYGDGDNR